MPTRSGQHVEEKSGKCLTSETFVSVKNSIVMETFSKSILRKSLLKSISSFLKLTLQHMLFKKQYNQHVKNYNLENDDNVISRI